MPLPPVHTPGGDVRDRLTAGLAAALEERRLADVTMNDIVGHARTSKRTFYEEVADKEACCLALYRRTCDELDRAQGEVADPAACVREQIALLVGVYLRALAEAPAVSRAALSDIVGGGASCLEARREQQDRYAARMRRFFHRVREHQPDAGIRPIGAGTAAALVGGINELVLRDIDAGRVDRLEELAPTIEDFIRSVVLDSR
jgi:AcrR family transcriptional regulator